MPIYVTIHTFLDAPIIHNPGVYSTIQVLPEEYYMFTFPPTCFSRLVADMIRHHERDYYSSQI
jgi:hypothetical protein